ncbi:MAG: ParB/RepB/Spo0J family partition protein [Clostridia bacterium]
METIRIADIKIGDRLREDLDDITALAESIKRYGLLAPPVLADDGTLVAGQRRVEAMKKPGWTEMPYIHKGKLTAERLHEIELEENIRRKDFTEFEISKNMVALAEVVGERLQTGMEVSAKPFRKNPLGGRPEKANRTAVIASEIDVTSRTIENAKSHVAAVETYQALETRPKMKAISIAKQAAKLPEEQRATYVEENIMCADKKRTARRLLSSFRDDDQTRAYYAACDRTGSYVGVKRCRDAETLKLVESQLRKKRDGINKSLGKVSRLKKSFGKAVCVASENSNETKALAEKLYAMADELQTLLAM